MRRLEITDRAGRDIDRALDTSRERHGPRTARRYEHLIGRALEELRLDPLPVGSRPAGRGEVRLYPLRLTARRLPPGEGVRAPAHLVVYRFDAERLQILRLLHEAMDLPVRLRHAGA